MSKAVIKIAQVARGEDLLAGTIREGRELYSPGALKLLPTRSVPVLVNHDPARVLGHVVALEEWDDTNGRWWFARCRLDTEPEWLRAGSYNGSAASMGWVNTGTSQELPGGWRRYNKALVTEVSVLSPSVRPLEPAARVVVLQRHYATKGTNGSPERDSDVILHNDGRSLRRYFPTKVTVRPVSGDNTVIRRNVGRVLGVR